MNKHELIELVEQAYATYNQELPADDHKETAVIKAWWEMLHDLDFKETKAAFKSIAVEAKFLPRPGEIRRATINRVTKMTPFEEPLAAWGIWITLQKEINSGMAPSLPVSDALKKTVQLLGDAAIGMHTNSDRDAFCRTYERVVSELDAERYAIPEAP